MTEQEVIERLTQLFKNRKAFAVGKVLSVDGNTCKVKPVNGDEPITGVLLSFVDEPSHLMVPAVDSVVVVGFRYINKMQTEVFVLHCSKYASYKMLANGSSSEFSLTKTETLITELNKTNALVNALKNALLNFVPVSGDGGAALKTFATTQVGALAVGDFSGIKNEKFKHG